MRLILVLPAAVCLVVNTGCGSRARQPAANSITTASSSGTGTTGAQVNGTEPQGGAQDARAYISKGIQSYKEDHDQEAADTFRQAIEVDPENAEAHYRLGLAYSSLGQKRDALDEYQKAVEAYKKLLREEPKNPDAHFNMGEADSRLGNYAEAVAEYKRAVQLKDDDSYMYYELGLADSKLAKYKDAVEAFQQAVRLDPDDFRAQEALDKAKENQKRLQAMIDSEIRRNARKNPDANTGSTTPTPTPGANKTPAPPGLTPSPSLR